MTLLSFNKLRKKNLGRCEEVFHALEAWSPTDWACAMAGECGGVCNEVKKLRRLAEDGVDFETEAKREALVNHIADELADTVIYADLLAARCGIDLGEAIINKFNKVSEQRGSGFVL